MTADIIARRPGVFAGTFTAADLMKEDLPPVRWAVPGILPEGLSLLAGKPKLGKSWLALGLAVAKASGGVALGKIPVEQGEVLYLAPVHRNLAEGYAAGRLGHREPERQPGLAEFRLSGQ